MKFSTKSSSGEHSLSGPSRFAHAADEGEDAKAWGNVWLTPFNAELFKFKFSVALRPHT